MPSEAPQNQPGISGPEHPFTALRISGADRKEFLQGQLTQDLNALQPGKAMLAGWNNPKGRLLCICLLAEWQDAIWMLLPAELATGVLRRLTMFVLRADVTIEESSLPVSFSSSDSVDNYTISYCNNNTYMNINCAPETAITVGTNPVTEPLAASSWRRAHIKAGLPWIWQETAEEFVPQMVNLDLLDAISFTKGCYVGQEIVARTQNLGRIKRRMYRFSTNSMDTPLPGSPVMANDKQVGQVVDAITADANTELLAVIRILAADSQLTLSDGSTLHMQTLPYKLTEAG